MPTSVRIRQFESSAYSTQCFFNHNFHWLMPHGTIFLSRQKYGKEAAKRTRLIMPFPLGTPSLKRSVQPQKENRRNLFIKYSNTASF